MLVKSVKDEFNNYLLDAANISGTCDKVFFPENTNDIVDIVREANRTNTKVTISGGRTGLNGGEVPDGGILIALDKFSKIINIDKKNLSVTLQPGVRLEDLQESLKLSKLFYPPDPTEINCTLGGTVANNASGARSYKYGSTRDYIQELKIVLPSGDCIKLKRGERYFEDNEFKEVTGY